MATIMDYLDWREDVTFAMDPFNDVDNIILSELAYVDFEGALEGTMSIQEVTRRYFQIHTKEEIEQRKTFYRATPFLLEKLADSKRFQHMEVSHYVNEVSAIRDMQMAALVFAFDHLAYIAYRGTDDTLIGWKEDFNFSYQKSTFGHTQALRYLNRVGKDIQKPLYVGGHSKGGNFAIYAAVYCLPDIQRRIQCVYCNDGPGFLSEMTHSREYQDMMPRIKRILPEQSLVGMLLDAPAGPIVVKSDQSGIMQHDGMSWQVLKNQLVTTELSAWSEFWNQTIDEWLLGLNAEDKQQFIDTIFGVFESADVQRLEDISTHAVELVKAINALPKEQAGHVQGILRKLIGSSTKVWLEGMRKK